MKISNDFDFIKKQFSDHQINGLNKKYRVLSVQDRIKEIYNDFDQNELMLTSSFAATSAFLLKLFSNINNDQPIYFINTGYHFQETLEYKELITEKYNLKVINVVADKREHEFTQTDKTWEKDPNFCCSLNKVKPLDIIKEKHNVWISGLMEWQSDHRSTLKIFEARGGILKFYPLLDVTKEEREEYINAHDLPFHPLVSQGYFSIGCTHCTTPGKGREGRWNNNPKTECGLHL